MNVEERLLRLEKIASPSIPGTSIGRVLTDTGMEWTVSIGRMDMPKSFFTAPTIEEAMIKAEAYFTV